MTAQIIMFVPRPNPDREKLIEQARNNYESIFPTEIANVALIGSPVGPDDTIGIGWQAKMTPHDAAIYESSLGFVAPPDDCA